MRTYAARHLGPASLKHTASHAPLSLLLAACAGKLSYDEWSRGVLSQPEVLHCFTISIPAASPLRPQRLVSGTRADAALLSRDSVSLATQLWWKSVMSSFFCGAQCG